MLAPDQTILQFLSDHKLKFRVLDHEPLHTSQQAAAIRGTSLEQGAKSLLLKSRDSFVLAVIPGHKRIDSKKIKKQLGTTDLRFARPDEVKAVMGCEVGACYPFGNLINVPMIVDTSLGDNGEISFNIGLHTRTVVMKYSDYISVVQPTQASITISE